MWKWLFNWEMGRGWKGLKVHTENMDIKGESGKVSEGNEDHVTGNRRKDNPSYKVAKNLHEKCFSGR